MNQVKDRASSPSTRPNDTLEAEIAALDGAPTGVPMQPRDYIFLAVTGIVIPVILLLWGWA